MKIIGDVKNEWADFTKVATLKCDATLFTNQLHYILVFGDDLTPGDVVDLLQAIHESVFAHRIEWVRHKEAGWVYSGYVVD